MQDYPASLKNLDPLILKKAIDIGNALLADGYPDDRAIPIATSQAKEWYDNASADEKEAFKKAKNPQKSDKHTVNKRAKKTMSSDVNVNYEDNQWEVQSEGAKRPSETFEKKGDAVKRGKEIAKNKQSKLNVYKQNGDLQQDFDYKNN